MKTNLDQLPAAHIHTETGIYSTLTEVTGEAKHTAGTSGILCAGAGVGGSIICVAGKLLIDTSSLSFRDRDTVYTWGRMISCIPSAMMFH